MEVDVTGQASLISQRRCELMTQIVLNVRRVVTDTRGRQSGREDAEENRAGCWEPIRAKGCNRVRVRRIAVKVVRIRRKGIHNAAVWKRLRRARTRLTDAGRGHRQPL